jgi:hypothetical protein
MRFLILILLILASSAYSQQNQLIYKTIDANGSTTFSEKPLNSNSVSVVLPTANTAPSTTSTSTIQTVPSVPVTNTIVIENTKKEYTTFDITSPANEETIQNQPVIPVSINLIPALQLGDKIQIYLDGAPWGQAMPSTKFEFTAPDRGTHVIYAEILDKNLKILKRTNSNTIYVHQAHIGSAPRSLIR